SLVKEVRASIQPEIEGRELEWQIGCLPTVECDPGLIKQVFANLLLNAIKYTRPRQRATIQVDQMICDGQPAVFVRDNGVGFDMKYADKLFGVFQRLHRQEDFEVRREVLQQVKSDPRTGMGLMVIMTSSKEEQGSGPELSPRSEQLHPEAGGFRPLLGDGQANGTLLAGCWSTSLRQPTPEHCKRAGPDE